MNFFWTKGKVYIVQKRAMNDVHKLAGGIEVHQLLSGRDFAKDLKGNRIHTMAYQMSNYGQFDNFF